MFSHFRSPKSVAPFISTGGLDSSVSRVSARGSGTAWAAARRYCSAALLPILFFVTLAFWGLMTVPGRGWAQASLADGVECPERDICRIKQTRLPLRVLPRAQSSIYEGQDKGGKIVEANVEAFVPLFVFKRSNISYANPTRPQGWFQVGKTKDRPDGYMHAEDALEWKTAMVLSYAHRGVGDNQRRPVIMFKDRRPLEDLVMSPKLPELAVQYYSRLTAGDPPESVITREPDTFVDIKRKFYLLPVLEAKDLTSEGLDDVRILQLAAAVPNARARADDACTTERGGAAFAKCSREVGTVKDDELKVNVVYAMDFTGSMGNAMAAVRRGMANSARLFTQSATADRVRFGLVGYRDHLSSDEKNEFVVRNFTPSLVDNRQFVDLMDQHAKPIGGGDWEEEVFAGMIEGLKSNWDPQAIKIIFLIGDASGHDPSHKFSTTGKDALFVRNIANEQSIQVASIYIKSQQAASDWAKGADQFRIMSENPGATPTFRAIEQDDANAIENAIAEATSEMVERIKKLYSERAATAASRSRSPEGPLIKAFEVGLVEFLGKATEPPKDITAWVVDRDLTNIGRKSFDVHVLATRTDLDQLTKGLQNLLDAYEQNNITNEGFFKTLQTITTVTALDVEVTRATALAQTNILPRWIEALPYKSEITSLRFSDFEEQTADKRQQLQVKLRSLVGLYRSILERREAWVKLNERMAVDDMVYPLPLDNLP